MSFIRSVRLPRDRLLTVLTTAAVLETVWTIYIGWRLPRSYVADHWDLAWVGLDVAQVVMLLLAAWAAWRRRALLILFASSSGTLLLVDAWFDITTARHGDLLESVVLAFVFEVPFAVVLFWVTRRTIIRFNRARLRLSDDDLHSIRKIPLPPRDGAQFSDPDQP